MPMTLSVSEVTERQLAKTIDHSLLRPELDTETVLEGIRLALRYDVASATVRPADVAAAARLVEGSGVMISTVVGFPHGSHTTRTKAAEAEELVAAGADELDMVLNIGRLKEGDDKYVLRELRDVTEAADERTVKVILETCLLSREEKIRACQLVVESGGTAEASASRY